MSTRNNQQASASPLQVVRTVVSAFFGVRRRRDHEAVVLSPVQVIVVGIVCAALFVGSLLLLVNFILSRVGTAG